MLPSPESTTFRNTYRDNARTQYMYHRARSISTDDLVLAPPTRVAHLGPVADEVPHSGQYFATRSFVGLTAQGLLRRLTPDQQVLTDATLLRHLPLDGIHAMALSEEDVNGDEDSVVAATERIPVVALTRAERGVTVWYDGQRVDVPAYQANVVDPTGAGDVFATAFFLALEAGIEPARAAQRANAAASCVIEGFGVETLPTSAEVAARMARR
jgi:hypothetical protein